MAAAHGSSRVTAATLLLHDAALPLDASRPEEGESVVHALFMRARKGEQAALQPLCTMMRPRLYRVAYSVVKDRDEADDIAQDALVRALNKRMLFGARGSVTGWMCRIAFNLARNRYRDKKRRGELLYEAHASAAQLHHGDPSPAPDDVAQQGATTDRVRAALEALPPRQRDVLTLRLLGELSFADIAGALGITEANARVTSSQGLAKLRATLADLDPTHDGSPS